MVLSADGLSSRDRACLESIQAALDDEDYAKLLPLVAEAARSVRAEACDAWTAGLSEIDDAAAKGALVASAMEVLTDADQLESMIMEINDLPNSKQIEILTRLIEGGNKAAADVAREHYEFVTGDPYEDAASAQKWLVENPDEPE